MQVEYQIVPHKGDYAMSINNKVYDTVAAFEQDYPLDQFKDATFSCEFDFSWHEIRNDIIFQWGE